MRQGRLLIFLRNKRFDDLVTSHQKQRGKGEGRCDAYRRHNDSIRYKLSKTARKGDEYKRQRLDFQRFVFELLLVVSYKCRKLIHKAIINHHLSHIVLGSSRGSSVSVSFLLFVHRRSFFIPTATRASYVTEKSYSGPRNIQEH